MNKPTNTAQLQTLTKAQKIKERDRMRVMKKWQKQQAGRQNYHRSAPVKNRDASVMVKDTWTVVSNLIFKYFILVADQNVLLTRK